MTMLMLLVIALWTLVVAQLVGTGMYLALRLLEVPLCAQPIARVAPRAPQERQCLK